jgi:transposase InsO family protein
VNWYHLVLNHVGANRLRDTISMFMSHPSLSDYCEEAVKRCPVCQRTKTKHRNYGDLPPREVPGLPWSDIAVDLIGPWKATIHGNELTFQALTIIDMVTNYCELIRVNNKTSRHVGLQLENAWLSRYPRPVRCLFDQGGEFIGHGFSRVLENHGIAPVPLTAKNPQSNAICERLHLTVGDVLRTLVHYESPNDIQDLVLLVDTALQTAAYSARTVIHGSLKHSPGSLAFHRDMLFDIPLIADMEVIRQRRQMIVDERARLVNRSRVSHDYAVGDRVLIRATAPDKLDLRTHPNPFTITRVHSNGTVTIQRGPYVTERINIRRILPFRQ